MKKYLLIFLSLIMLFTCWNTDVFAQKNNLIKKSTAPTLKSDGKDQVAKKTSRSGVTKKKKRKKAVRKKTSVEKKEVVNQDNQRTKICSDSLIARAKSHLGTHYRYASYSPTAGFDCSGFVYYVFGTFDVKVPRSSIDYGSLTDTIAPESAQIGDVIVFTGTNAKIRHAGHVGIVISNPGEELTFIHSSSNTKRGGVIISTYKSSPYYKVRFLKIVRLENAVVGNYGL